MSQPKHLDSLTALVMVAQAEPADIVRVSFGRPGHRKRRDYCLRHLEEVQVRRDQRRKNYCKFVAPDMFGRIIARDDIVDLVKVGAVRVYSIRRPGEYWFACRHCRGEQRERV